MRNKLLIACIMIILVGAALNLRLGYSIEKMLPIFAAILAGMFFCDLDVPLYWVRQRLVIIVVSGMLLLFGALYYFYGGEIMKFCPVSGQLQCIGIYFFISLAISALFAHCADVLAPFKEGPLHGVIPSIIFGVAVLGAYYYFFGLEVGIMGGVLAFATSIFHLFLDAGRND